MTAIAYVHNKHVLRAYQSLYKKLKSGGVFVHLQNKRYFESGSDRNKRYLKEKIFRLKYLKMMMNSIDNS